MIASLQIFDSQGKSIFQINEIATTHQINVANWTCGIYWIELLTKEGVQHFEKIVKK